MIKYEISYDKFGKHIFVLNYSPSKISSNRIMRNSVSWNRKYTKDKYKVVLKKANRNDFTGLPKMASQFKIKQLLNKKLI